jgi:ABC-type bacteriocin/lantibiotic exporter with double-glycine peptidase domain
MITWFPQQQRASCVAACVRMVLTGFGQRLTEQQVCQALRLSPAGTTLPKAYRQLLRQNIIVELHEDWSLVDLRDCLRAGWYPIVGIERRLLGHPDASHAIVLVKISSRAVSALDPLGSTQAETFSTETFEQAWNSAGHQTLVIQSPFP